MMSAHPQIFVGAAVLLPLLCAVAIVDLRRMIIPDALNLSLAVCGFAYQLVAGNDALLQLAFAGVGICAFWLLRGMHLRLSGSVGLGLGDVKFIGAAALWIGPLSLPMLLLIASGSALAFVAGRAAFAGQDTIRERVPFGPFLSLGLACAWIVEQTMDLGGVW